ncbi:MAG: ATP-binding protein, partial [Victivallales bacterium]|nr:ATP-binding protein [Victivallales bacterium]
CHCTAGMIMSYRSRISGPLIDRVDMHIELAPLDSEMLTQKRCGEDSATIRAKVMAAREIQRRRYAGTGIRDNASLSGKMMDQFCELDTESAAALQSLIMELQLSARAYDRILRVARTLADLDGLERIERRHIQEAANYRILDRQQW